MIKGYQAELMDMYEKTRTEESRKLTQRREEIKNKYPAAICLALGFFLSIVISVMFCLVKKMVDEYQQNSGQ